MTSYDVRFWDIKKRNDGRSRPYRLRWAVGGREREEYFATKGLADSFRAKLMIAARAGEPFDVKSGLPDSMLGGKHTRSWYAHACAYAEMKWPTAAAKSRRAIAEALATVTPALVGSARGGPDPAGLHRALLTYAFNPSTRGTEPPADIASALRWIEAASLNLADLGNTETIRVALNACALTKSKKAAAATTSRRKRAVLYNALRYAVELGLLESNPIDKVQWKAPEVAKTVDRRVVANADQVRALLSAVRSQGRRGEHLVAFFGCLYYAGMRPSEALALRVGSCVLPAAGWGRLDLSASSPSAGARWTDDGSPRDERGLKRRGEKETRSVPIPPELVQLLREHVDRFGAGPDGRLFRSQREGAVQDSAYATTWRRARQEILTPAQAASPLARRPYDLRHAAVSLWLNAGVPATEVARRAGHGVDVLLRVYANCIDGQEWEANDRIAEALGAVPRGGHRGRLDDVPAGASRAEPPSEEGAQ